MNEQFRAGKGGGEGEAQGLDGGDRREEPVGQTIRQRTKAHKRQDAETIVAENLSQCDEAFILADEAVYIAREDGPARDKCG